MPEVPKEQWRAAGKQEEGLSTCWSQAVTARGEEPGEYTNGRGIFHLSPSSRTHSSPEAHRDYHTPTARHTQVPSTDR